MFFSIDGMVASVRLNIIKSSLIDVPWDDVRPLNFQSFNLSIFQSFNLLMHLQRRVSEKKEQMYVFITGP
jgi:hypothetical protein